MFMGRIIVQFSLRYKIRGKLTAEIEKKHQAFQIKRNVALITHRLHQLQRSFANVSFTEQNARLEI